MRVAARGVCWQVTKATHDGVSLETEAHKPGGMLPMLLAMLHSQ
jgi:hypothetical protein